MTWNKLRDGPLPNRNLETPENTRQWRLKWQIPPVAYRPSNFSFWCHGMNTQSQLDPDSGALAVDKGPFLFPFLPIIAKVIATLLFRRMSNQKLNEARIGLLCCSILEMEVSSF